MKMSFWENEYLEGTGGIIVSEVSEKVIEQLGKDFTLDRIMSPQGHSDPTYAMRHSDEVADCTKEEFEGLLAKYQATVV